MSHNDLHSDGAAGIVALVADLMFASRIRGTAPAAKVVQRADGLPGAVGASTRLVLVDLHARGALDAIAALREAGSSATIIAFGSHVETAALQAARDAGADRVMARSGFVRELPGLVAGVARVEED